MAKSSNSRPTTVDDMVADLKSKGGYHRPWHEVRGANLAPILRAAISSGLVEITSDNGLRLTETKDRSKSNGS